MPDRVRNRPILPAVLLRHGLASPVPSSPVPARKTKPTPARTYQRRIPAGKEVRLHVELQLTRDEIKELVDVEMTVKEELRSIERAVDGLEHLHADLAPSSPAARPPRH